jgi:Cys-rich protein (TIGR01571 family)
MAGLLGGITGAIGGAASGAAGETAYRMVPKLWGDGICGCCSETAGCCDVVFCPFCQMSRQCAAVDGQPNTMDCAYCLCAMAAAYQGGLGAAVYATVIRIRMISKYNIQMETPIMSACLGVVCAPCSLCQTNRELMRLGLNPAGTCCVPPTPPNAGPTYQISQGMMGKFPTGGV